MNADQALSLLGKYNKWQLQNYLILAFSFGVPFSWIVLSIIFIGDTPNYRCALPPNATLNETIPWRITEEGVIEYEKCSMYRDLSVDNTTVSCQYGYWYDPNSGYESTLTTEFDLVCGYEWLVELSMMLSAVGSIIGALVFNKLADRFGRKNVFLGCLWSNLITAMAKAFSPNMAFYIVLTGIQGMQQEGMIATAYIMAVELFATEERTFPGNAIEFFWVFGYMSMVLVAYLVRNWRRLLISLTAPLFITVSFYWILPESIPWLVSNGRKREAEDILKKAAKKININIPDNIFDVNDSNRNDARLLCKEQDKHSEDTGHRIVRETENRSSGSINADSVSVKIMKNIDSERNETDGSEESTTAGSVLLTNRGEITNINLSDLNDEDIHNVSQQSVTKYRVIDLMRSKTIRRYSLPFFVIWFVDSLAYGAINSTVTYLPGDRYLNTILYAFMEIPAYAITWILSDKLGRRIPLISFHMVGGIALMSTAIQTFEFSRHINWLIVMLSLIGKLSLTSAFALIFVIAPEIFPTNSRNIGLGLCGMSARSAQLLSPHARILYRHIPWLSPLLLGILSTMTGVLSFVVPETRHTKLPDTIEEIEEWDMPSCC